MKRALYLSHTGMSEALGQHQVLPYLRGVARGGVAIDLVACEPPGTEVARVEALRAALWDAGIRYQPLLRRPGSGLLAKAGDVADLWRAALRCLLRAGAGRPVVHARSQLPAAAAEVVARLCRGRLIFDCRGLLAEEYVELGNWRRGELRYRLAQGAERHLLRHADRVVVLTQALKDALCAPGGPLHGRPGDVRVIPCCVDEARFRPDPAARAARRRALGLEEGTPLFCFSGSLRRYDLDATVALFDEARRLSGARFLLLSGDDPAPLLARLLARGHRDAVHRVAAPPDEVPSWLAAADVGLALLPDTRPNLAASPTKVGEFLASGLLTVVRAGVGDSDRLAGAGLLAVPALAPGALGQAARALLDALGDRAAARARAREAALRHFSLSGLGVRAYQALYSELA